MNKRTGRTKATGRREKEDKKETGEQRGEGRGGRREGGKTQAESPQSNFLRISETLHVPKSFCFSFINHVHLI